MQVQRVFMPGSEWLYYKIYSGPKTLEKLLLNGLRKVLEDLSDKKIVDKYFFIRYNDPDYHLRIRLHVVDIANLSTVIQAFKNATEYYINERIIWKFSIDSYTRELERYGANIIEDVEALFYYHSKAALMILNMTGDETINDRWIWGSKYIDMLLDKFGLSLPDKVILFEHLSNGYLTEFNQSKTLKLQLDWKVRSNKLRVEEIFSLHNKTLSKLCKPLSQNIIDSKEIIEKILYAKATNKLEVNFNNLLGSIIHMHYNRLFRTQQRHFELVIYYIMVKYYKSKAIQMKCLQK